MFVWFIYFIQSDFTPIPSPQPLPSWSQMPPFPFSNFSCPDCICADVNITCPTPFPCPSCPPCPNLTCPTIPPFPTYPPTMCPTPWPQPTIDPEKISIKYFNEPKNLDTELYITKESTTNITYWYFYDLWYNNYPLVAPSPPLNLYPAKIVNALFAYSFGNHLNIKCFTGTTAHEVVSAQDYVYFQYSSTWYGDNSTTIDPIQTVDVIWNKGQCTIHDSDEFNLWDDGPHGQTHWSWFESFIK